MFVTQSATRAFLVTRAARAVAAPCTISRVCVLLTGIIVDEFNIVNFEFSKVFNDAIEAKVTAHRASDRKKRRE
jgi:hypothetical protein